MTKGKNILLCLTLLVLCIFSFASCKWGSKVEVDKQIERINVYQTHYDLTTNSSIEDVRNSISVYVTYYDGSMEDITDYQLDGNIVEGYCTFYVTYREFLSDISIYFQHGHNLERIEAVEGTCVAPGNIEYWICYDCNEKFLDSEGMEYAYDVTEYGEHHWETISGYAPTCTEYGLSDGIQCDICYYVEEYQYTISPLGHTPVNGEYCTEAELCATCGYVFNGFDHTMTLGSCIELPYCLNCSYVADSYGEHHIVVDEPRNVTCTDFGLTAGEHCDICLEVFVPQEKIPAEGHNYVVVSEVKATCTENGLKVVSCTVCRTQVTQVTPARGHSIHNFVSEVPATCEQSGSITGYCSLCSEYITVEIPALGHIAGEFIFENEYCGDQKLGYLECTVCSGIIQSFGHAYRTTSTDPTCTAEGSRVTTCSNCGDSHTETIAALGHTRGEWSVLADPTCTAVGFETLTCAFCDTVLQTREIPTKTHNYESAVGATGITYTCTLCSDSYFVETEQTVTVSFVTVLDDVVCAPISVNKGYTANLPILEKDGYHFNGWYLDEELEIECLGSYVFDEDITLYASWSVVAVEGSASSESIVTNAPLDFTFRVKSSIRLTNSNLKKYVSIEDIEGRSPELYISAIDGDVYTIASDEYLDGMSYEVIVYNGASLVGTEEMQLMFVTEAENSANVVYKDSVIFVSESNVLTAYEDADGKIYFFLRRDLLNSGDIVVIYGEDMNDVILIMKVVAEGDADNVIDGAFVYEVESVDADEVFVECEIYFSGEIDTENMEFAENLEEELIEMVEESALYAQIEYAARQYAKGAVIGNYYYEFSKITVKPTFTNDKSTKTIKINIDITSEFERLHTETREVDSILTITFKIQNNLKFNATVDYNNLKNFSVILDVNNKTTVELYVSSGEKHESKEELKYFKTVFLKAKEEGAFDELDSSNASNSKEMPVGNVMFNFFGINFNFELSNVFNFEVVGQLGMKAELNVNVKAGLQCKSGDLSVVRSFSSNAYLDFYMMGKIKVSDTVKIKTGVSLLGIVNANIDIQAGPYFEMGGATIISISSGGGVSANIGGYIEMGLTVKSTASLNAKIFKLEVYNKKWNLIEEDYVFFKIGDHIMTLYFADVKEEITIEYVCGSNLSLADFVNRTIVQQNLKNMSKTTSVVNCTYMLLESPSYVRLSSNGILSFKDDTNDAIVIKVKLQYGNIYKTVEITVNVTHNDLVYAGFAPTCTKEGYTDGKLCPSCDKILEDRVVIPATGHTASDPVAENNIAPTCINTGSYDDVVYCSVCKIELSSVTVIVEAKGHSEKIDPYRAPTCTKNGLTEGSSCADCSHIFVAQESIPAFGHTEVIDPAIEPTCLNSGLKEGAHCSVCEEVIVQQMTAYPLGHEYQDDVCIRCGTGKTGDKLNFRLSSDGRYYIVNGIGQCTDSHLVIPQEYNGLPVKSINDSAFKNCTTLVSVTIPESVTSIGINAFYGCSNIVAVFMTDSITSIGSYAFYNCSSLLNVVIPDKVTNIPSYTFQNCTSLKSITIGTGVSTISASAFSGCKAVEELCFNATKMSDLTSGTNAFANLGQNGSGINVVVGKNVTRIPAYLFYASSSAKPPKLLSVRFEEGSVCTSIGAYSFYGSTNLRRVTLPDSVTIISSYAFNGCTLLEEISFGSGLQSIGTYAFYNCTYLTEITIPDSVTEIGDYTFSSCRSIESVEMGNSVKKIGICAFYNCTYLTEITIPETVTTISSNAFSGCRALEKIYFNAASLNALSSGNGVFSYAGQNGDGITLVIGDAVTRIPAYLFYPDSSSTSYSPNLKKIEFREGSVCQSVDNYAFYACKSLTDVNISDSVVTIGNYAFNSCSALQNVVIGKSVATIGDYAFYNCASLITVSMGNVEKIGNYAFAQCKSIARISIPDSVTEIGAYAFNTCTSLREITIPDSVTNIGNYAFASCSSLKSVRIGKSVKSIGTYAFSNCTAIESIYFGAVSMDDLTTGNGVFYRCGKDGAGIDVIIGSDVTKVPAYFFYPYNSASYTPYLTSVSFDEGSVCESIGAYAFYECYLVKSVELADSITSIGDRAFYGCDSLSKLVLSEGLSKIGAYAFYDCYSLSSLTLGDKVVEIGTYAFYNGDLISSLTIPDSVTSIGAYAFASCQGLVNLTLGSALTTIGNNAFYSCESIKSVVIPDSVTAIGTNAFANCSGMTSLTIGKGVTNIGNYAFHNCSNLSEIYFNAISANDFTSRNYIFSYAGQENTGIRFVISNEVTTLPEYLFYPYDSISYTPNIASVVFEDESVCQRIGSYAFYRCYLISAITIPDSVTDIGSFVFSGCENLESVIIGNGITEIDARMFADCNSLKSVTIGDGVSAIGDYAFSNCISLASVTLGSNLISIGNNAFYCCESLTEIVIPDSVTSIGNNAFSGCIAIKSLTIGSGVTSIGNYAFYNCERLEKIIFKAATVRNLASNNYVFSYAGCESKGIEVIIGAGVIAIPSYLFSPYNYLHSPNVISVTIEEGGVCESIGNYAFCNCISLKSINISDGVKSLGVGAFKGCESLTDVVLGNGVTVIDAYAFDSCVLLENVTFGNGVTSIGNYAFSDCTSLKSIDLPNSLISIGNAAFYQCESITDVVVPDSVTSIGSGAFGNCYSLKSITIPFVGATKDGTLNAHFGYIFGASLYSHNYSYTPEELTTVVITGGTVIADNAFNNCQSIVNITIPESVITIGRSAFYNCLSIEKIYFNAIAVDDLDGGNYVFYAAGDNGSGVSVIIGSSVTKVPANIFSPYYSNYAFNLISVQFEEGSKCESVGDSAFRNCTKLNDIVLPDSVTNIGEYAFCNCNNLSIIDIPERLSEIGDWTFSYTQLESIVIPESVTKIGSNAFYGCSYIKNVYVSDLEAWFGMMFENYASNPLYYATNFYVNGELITDLVIPDTVTSIGQYAFYGFKSLSRVIIPDNVTIIGNSAFYNCASLTDVKIGSKVESIDVSAFYNCKALMNIIIPDSVTYIGDSAFGYCSELLSISIGNGVKTIGHSAFRDCKKLTSVVIPDSVTSVGGSLFAGCSSLSNVTLGSGIARISSSMFYGCSALMGIVIPENVGYIESAAFSGCSALESVIIPDNVISIGKNAFLNCGSLKNVSIGKSVISIGADAFLGCTAIDELYFNAKVMSDLGENNNIFASIGQQSEGVKVVIGKDVKRIPAYLFYPSTDSGYTPKIVRVEFEDDSVCARIGAYSFYNLADLESLKIGKAVNAISENAFSGCTALNEIYLDAAALDDFGAEDYILTYAGQRSDGIKLIIGKNVTKIPAYLFYPYTSDSSYMPNIVSIEFEEGSVCESIGDYAFYGCTSLTSVVIPESVKSIGASAFEGCTGLASVTLENGLSTIASYAFKNCDSIDSIVIPESVTFIGASALEGCVSLRIITIPFVGSSLNETKNNCFGYLFGANTYSENSKYVPASLESVVIIADTSIGSYNFYGCSSLKSITLPSTLTSIGEYAFRNCSELTEITIPVAITSIAYNTFDGCSNLVSITIPDGVTSIGKSAFNNCSSLESVTIPASVTSIDSNAFSNCYNIKRVYISDVAAWCGIVFSSSSSNPLSYVGDLYLNGERVTKLVIPEDVSAINNYAFYSCGSITDVVISKGVTSIGEWAFYSCTKITSITIPDTVTTINRRAILYCSALKDVYITDVGAWCNIYFVADDSNPLYYASNLYINGELVSDLVIPDGVTAIPAYAFRGTSITHVSIPESVTKIGSRAFAESSIVSLTIPGSVLDIGSYAFYNSKCLVSAVISDGVQTIGDYAFYGCSSMTSVEIGNNVTTIGNSAFAYSGLAEVVIPDSVETIKSSAFYYCTNLESVILSSKIKALPSSLFFCCSNLSSVTMGSNVTDISSYVFYECSSLKSIDLSENITVIGERAFDGCSSIESITIPESVTAIGRSAFNGCSSLSSVSLPQKVTVIEANTFSYCSSLISIALGNDITSIGEQAFIGCTKLESINMPDKLTDIGDSAFQSCESLVSVVIPDGVTSIAYAAFRSCKSLVDVTIGEKVVEIEGYAFADCTSLKSASIPDSVTTIGAGLFYECTALESASIGNGITVITSSMFEKCSNLTDIEIPDSVIAVKSYSFSGCSKLIKVENGVSYVDKWVIDCDTTVKSVVLRSDTEGIAGDAFSGCMLLTEIVIPEGVKSIGDYAFSNCISLKSVTIPKTVISIGIAAFYHCSSLTNVVIPEGVVTIASYAFELCSNLKSVVVPNSVTSIGYSAFHGCSSLTSITLPFVGTKKDGTDNHFGSIFGASIYQENGTYVPKTLVTVVINGGNIDTRAFNGCNYIKSVTIGSGVKRIGAYAFYGCSALNSVTFESPTGWLYALNSTATSGNSFAASSLRNTSTAATYLKSNYYSYYWFKN